MTAKKCWRCGYFQDTVSALIASSTITASLGPLLDEGNELLEPKRYDCLGCEICWPATAQNIAAELDPVVADGTAAPRKSRNDEEGGRRCPATTG